MAAFYIIPFQFIQLPAPKPTADNVSEQTITSQEEAQTE
jgi:hypothetical protein